MWYLYSETPLQNLTFQYMPTQRLNTEKDKDILTCLMQVINSTGTYQYIIGTILFLFKLGQPGQRRQLQSSISSHGGCPKSTYWNKKTLSSLLQNSSGPAQWNWSSKVQKEHPSTGLFRDQVSVYLWLCSSVCPQSPVHSQELWAEFLKQACRGTHITSIHSVLVKHLFTKATD